MTVARKAVTVARKPDTVATAVALIAAIAASPVVALLQWSSSTVVLVGALVIASAAGARALLERRRGHKIATFDKAGMALGIVAAQLAAFGVLPQADPELVAQLSAAAAALAAAARVAVGEDPERRAAALNRSDDPSGTSASDR